MSNTNKLPNQTKISYWALESIFQTVIQSFINKSSMHCLDKNKRTTVYAWLYLKEFDKDTHTHSQIYIHVHRKMNRLRHREREIERQKDSLNCNICMEFAFKIFVREVILNNFFASLAETCTNTLESSIKIKWAFQDGRWHSFSPG